MNEQLKKFQDLKAREDKAHRAVSEYARTIEPSLRDAGLNHQADRLSALLGDLDAVMVDIQLWIKKDPQAIVELLLSTIEKQR